MGNKKKYYDLLKNIFALGFGLVGAKGVQFLLLPYFTNVLTTGQYGVIDLVVTFVGLMVPIVTLELSDSVLRFGLSEETNKTDLIQCSTIILAFAALLSIILSPLLYFYKSIREYSPYVVLMIVLQSIRVNSSLYVKSQNRVSVYSMDSALTAFVTAILDIYFISILKIGLQGYFLAELIGTCVSITFLFFVGGIYRNFKLNQPLDKVLLKRMLSYSIPLMFNAISWWIASFSDRAMLNLFFSESEVGIYSVAAKIPAIITTLLSVFTQAWIMSAVREYEKERNPIFFERVYKIYSAFLFLSVAALSLVIRPIMKIYVGQDFFKAWYYIPLLLFGTVFLGISNYYGAIYAAAKANLLEIKSTIICAVSNIIMNLIFIPHYSILGAVYATALSYVIVVIVRILDTRKLMHLKIGILDLAMSSALLLALVWFVMQGNVSISVLLFIMLLAWKVGYYFYEYRCV